MKLHRSGIFLIALILFPIGSSFAQYSPHLANYSLSEYNAGNQNWDISMAPNGKLYVANNNGLLEYDGLKWSFMRLPNKTTIRSVFAHNDLVYTGSFEEFGYWKKNSKGILVYKSLSDLVKNNVDNNEEFWQILTFKNSILFRSFSNLYVYEDGVITQVKPPSTIISCDVVDNTLYVSTLKDGIFKLEKNKLNPLISNELLKDTKVLSITNIENGLLISTALKGCFIYSNKKLGVWQSEINSFIKQHQLNTHSKLENGNMVFGTIQNGVYYTDSTGNVLFQVNKKNGLVNNTVLSQCLGSENEIWLGLDNGLASIDLNNHISFYRDVTGKLGAVYDVIMHNDIFYIGSNTGLYYLDKDQELVFIEGSQGQVWDLKEIDGNLFCGHNNGTYLVKNDQLTNISSFTGGWVLKKVPERKSLYIQGTYAGLVRFEKKDGKWTTKHMGRSTNPIRFLEFEDQHNAWAAHAYKGLYKITFSKNYDSILKIKNYNNKGLLADFNVKVYKIKNEICFKTNLGWQKYEPIRDSIVNYDILDKTWGKESYIISEENMTPLVVKNNERIWLETFSESEDNFILSPRYFKEKLIIGYENVSQISDSTLALSLNDGFMLVNKDDRVAVKDSLEKPSIERIIVNQESIDLNVDNEIKIPYNNKLSVAVSSANSKNHFFEYTVSNTFPQNWVKMEDNRVELSNLNNGKYSLLIRTANDFSSKSPYTQLNLVVLTPWYKGTSAVLLLALLITVILIIIYYFHKRKIAKEQRLLQLKFDTEQKELIRKKTIESEKQIIELKAQALENEVNLKSKQLANTAMALVKKNEALQEIKNELLLNKNNFDNQYTFKRLKNRIDNSIGHEDEWEIFEYNFNQVHKKFFNQLKQEFPHLTHKDLKICAYIKMNLRNKEIAPLMNITTRGVETHRYRLKRKLNLENGISLGDFLFNFQ